MTEIDKAARNIVDSLFYLNGLFEAGIMDFVKRGLIVTAIFIGTHIFMLIVIIVIMIAFYLRRLDSEYKRLRTIIGMIPLDVLAKDEIIKKRFTVEFSKI